MPVTDTLARDNGALDINTGTVQSPVWTPVGGINSWSPSPTLNRADTTKFSDQGNLAHLPASKGMTYTFTGFRQVDESTGARDAGQLACEQLSEQLGPDGIGQFRHSRAGGKVTVFFGSVTVTDGGGGNDDPDAWEIEIERTGVPTTTDAINALPAVVTSVTGTDNEDSAIIDWTDGEPEGDLFEIVIYDDVTGEIVKQVLVSEHPALVALEAGDYVAKVRARNDAGWSALSAASSKFTVTTSGI